MARGRMIRGIQIGLLVAMFAAGFFFGSLTQRSADAQLKELGQSAVQKSGQSGGALGSAVELGKSVVEMQQHVDGLQKNINTLKTIQSALGG
jgi:hypothetical protein